MKDFLEKLKDFLYDGVDYIIMIAIVIGVFLIINWRLDGLFAKNDIEPSPQPPKTIAEDQSNHTNSADSNENDESNDSSPSNEVEKEASNKIIEVDIPAGSASSNIGDILVSKDLIKEKDVFLKKLLESNLETKLRHGKYEIPENSSLDEILNILTK